MPVKETHEHSCLVVANQRQPPPPPPPPEQTKRPTQSAWVSGILRFLFCATRREPCLRLTPRAGRQHGGPCAACKNPAATSSTLQLYTTGLELGPQQQIFFFAWFVETKRDPKKQKGELILGEDMGLVEDDPRLLNPCLFIWGSLQKWSDSPLKPGTPL